MAHKLHALQRAAERVDLGHDEVRADAYDLALCRFRRRGQQPRVWRLAAPAWPARTPRCSAGAVGGFGASPSPMLPKA